MENLRKLVILNIVLTILLGSAFVVKFTDNPLKRIIKPDYYYLIDFQESKSKKIAQNIKEDFDNFWKKNDENLIDWVGLEKPDGFLDVKKNIYWAEQIKKGGYTLLVRHGEREKWQEAITGFDAYELYNKIDPRETSWPKAVCLTDRGIETMKLVKKVFEQTNLKVQKVFSSPSCRAIETAFYGFGRVDEIHSSLLHLSAYHPLDHKKMSDDLKNTILNFDLDKDKLLILSTHNYVINYSGLIDQFDIAGRDIDETGFYVIEKKDNKLIIRHRFYASKMFHSLMYRFNPEIKSCINPEKVDKEKKC